MPSPDHGTMPKLRAGVLYGSPSCFCNFLCNVLLQCCEYHSLHRSFDTHGCKLITLYYDQLPDTGGLILIQHAG